MGSRRRKINGYFDASQKKRQIRCFSSDFVSLPSVYKSVRKKLRSSIHCVKIRRYMFGSASPDAIKQWKCPEGKFVQNLLGHNAIINCLAVNQDGVLMSGADNGSMYAWDWRTGYNFQKLQVRSHKY